MHSSLVPTGRQQASFALEAGLILRNGVSVFRVAELRAEAIVIENSVDLSRKLIGIDAFMAQIALGQLIVVGAEEERRALNGDRFLEDDQVKLVALPPSIDSPAGARFDLKLRQIADELRRRGNTSLVPTKRLELELRAACRTLDFGEPPCSIWTVYKWDKQSRAAARTGTTISRRYSDRGGRGIMRINTAAELALDEVLKRLKEAESQKVIYSDVEDDVEVQLFLLLRDHTKVSEHMPSRSTITRRTRSVFSQEEIDRRNLGKAAARKSHRHSTSREAPPTFTLECLQFDDKDSQVYTLDRRSGLPWGRTFITAGVDDYSEAAPGWETSPMHRSVWSAKSALLNCILPKNQDHPDFADALTPYRYWGKPFSALFDNALYNHCDDLQMCCHDAEIVPRWSRSRTPTDKDRIERFWATLQRDFLRKQPGYAAKHVSGAHDEAVQAAIIYQDEFRKRFARWLCDEYQLTPGSKGLSPRQRWEEGARIARPRIPANVAALKLLAYLVYAKPLRLRPEGVRFMGLPYECDHLRELKALLGARVPTKLLHHPFDLETICVLDLESRTIFEVPIASSHREYVTGLSLLNHRCITKMLRDKGKKKSRSQRTVGDTGETLPGD
jgi:hypothetical protein